MTARRHLLRSAAALAAAVCMPVARADDRALRIVVPYPPGGGSDRAARLIAEALRPTLGTVVVENVVGAGGRLAARQLAGQTPAGPVLILANPAVMVVAPVVFRSSGYEPDRDFQPVSTVSRYEFVVAVGADMPVRSIAELRAWIKANPGKANLGVPASGSLPHFFAMMLAQAAGVEATVVPYKGSAPMVTDLVGGHLPVAFDTVDSLLPLHESGKVRILATSGEKRQLPQVPTLRESGLDLTGEGWNTFFAKASMPTAEVDRLAAAVAAVMRQPAMQKAFADAVLEAVSAERAATRADLERFKERWLPTIRKSGLSFD